MMRGRGDGAGGFNRQRSFPMLKKEKGRAGGGVERGYPLKSWGKDEVTVGLETNVSAHGEGGRGN